MILKREARDKIKGNERKLSSGALVKVQSSREHKEKSHCYLFTSGCDGESSTCVVVAKK
jgi:hypothetical protein